MDSTVFSKFISSKLQNYTSQLLKQCCIYKLYMILTRTCFVRVNKKLPRKCLFAFLYDHFVQQSIYYLYIQLIRTFCQNRPFNNSYFSPLIISTQVLWICKRSFIIRTTKFKPLKQNLRGETFCQHRPNRSNMIFEIFP